MIMGYEMEAYDVAVVGAGHAGCEAALAAARLGLKTVLFTISLDGIANLPCNPSIGGTAKGHLVREVDALGGEMGRAADKTFLQSRILNRGKGPAVHSLRVQTDRVKYHNLMKKVLEQQENLSVKQAEIIDIRTDENNRVTGVVTKLGAVYPVSAAVLSCGTYLNGLIHVGSVHYESGPDGTTPAKGLTQNLERIGIEMRRFKTGTPSRVHRRSIDFSQLEEQDGDEEIVPFSFETTEELHNRVKCHIAYTNPETHRIIRENLHRSPLYGGLIEGVGPRYCPSIEDKVVRFLQTRNGISYLLNRWGWIPTRCICRGCPPACPKMCRLHFCTPSKDWNTLKSCAMLMRSNMIAVIRSSFCRRWNLNR